MDCLLQQPIWTGAYANNSLNMPQHPQHHHHHHHHSHYYSPYYFPKKRSMTWPCYQGTPSFPFPSKLKDFGGYPSDMKQDRAMKCFFDDEKDVKACVVCGERASGYYFGALVCLPCKSFYIRCTKDGEPSFTCQCNGNCDIAKQGRIRCQYCRYQRCLIAGMCRKEKPESVQPAEGQVLCKVCGDIANGIHFGVNTCEGCKKFFRRGLVENQGYVCKGDKNCLINPRNRNTCRFCRYQKCIYVGMSREAIKMGRPKKCDGSESPCHPDTSSSSCSEGLEKFENENEKLSNWEHSSKVIKTESQQDTDNSCLKMKRKSIKSDCDKVHTSRSYWNNAANNGQSWHQPINNMMVSQDNMGQEPGYTPAASTSVPLSFGEEDMDDILDYLQSDQMAPEPYMTNGPYPQPPHMVTCNNTNNNQVHDAIPGSPHHSQMMGPHSPPECTPQYPCSPNYSDASASPQYQPNSPMSTYSHSPDHHIQYNNQSPIHYQNFSNSQDCMYPRSPESHSSYCHSPKSDCAFSPQSMDNLQNLDFADDCQSVVKPLLNMRTSMTAIHPSGLYSPSDSFKRSR